MHRLVFEDLEGRPVSLERFAGRPLLIDVWATWCAPCRKSRKVLESIADAVSEHGVIISLSVDRDGPSVVREFIRTHDGGESPFIELMQTDPGFRQVLKAHDRQPTIPKLVYVDSAGRIVDIEYGVPDPAWVLERVKSLAGTGNRG